MSETVDMLAYEKAAQEQGFEQICGVDEVGWGPLAGPIYSCAVILPKDFDMAGVTDSKKLSEKKREALYEPLCQRVTFFIGICTVEEFESMGPGAARWESMCRAVAGLQIQTDYALVDGNHMPKLEIPGQCIVKGDSVSASIGAASIIAKVARDRYMVELAKEYPQYGFELHKGYGTPLHMERLRQHGPCPAHRSQYIRKVLAK